MGATIAPRVVITSRPSEWDLLLERHATPGQARFFLETRGRSTTDVLDSHRLQMTTMTRVEHAVPRSWRRARVNRADLPSFMFEPEDILVAVGQDGLVPNVAKYLSGQPVIGVNPDPTRYEGTLVRTTVDDIPDLFADATAGRVRTEERTMVEARLDDGQRLVALNEIFIGHRTHQSSRYHLHCDHGHERQSSSGVIVTTGTGASGWARSIKAERGSSLSLPHPTDRSLAFFVREAWASVSSGTQHTEGIVDERSSLRMLSEMEAGGVAFGDGIESDHLAIGWGQEITIGIAPETLRLVAV